MSGIDLWDDDLGADSATVEVPPLYIHLIAASEHEAFWRLGLEDHGVRVGDADAAECIALHDFCPREQRQDALPRQRDGRGTASQKDRGDLFRRRALSEARRQSADLLPGQQRHRAGLHARLFLWRR